VNDGQVFVFAGIWETGKDASRKTIETCSILTTTPNAVNSTVHDRMPVILEPYRMTDANGNRTQVAFDTLGMGGGTAVMEKRGAHQGDTLEGFVADLPERAVLEHMRRPLHDPWRILQGATTRLVYDLFAYARTRHDSQPQPAAVYTMARETHVSDLRAGENQNPACLFLLRWLQPRDSKEASGRARTFTERRTQRRSALDRKRLDNFQ
jgi:hypothetical protein